MFQGPRADEVLADDLAKTEEDRKTTAAKLRQGKRALWSGVASRWRAFDGRHPAAMPSSG